VGRQGGPIVPEHPAQLSTVVALVKESIMWYGVGIIGLIIWIAIAFWPARVARRKGHSFVGYFLLSLLFFPLSLIMAYLVHDRRELAVS